MIILPSDYWEIKKTSNKGRGIFAKKDIHEGAVIGDYLGKIINPQEAVVDEENFYLMYYHDRAVISPDPQKVGIHFINHSCVPNTFIYIYKGHTLAFARKKINKGEELTSPYLLAPKDKFCDPCLHICRCGNLECSGTMHLTWETYKKWRSINEAQAKETKKERITYGKELPPLSSYPEKISNEYINEINRLFSNW